MPRDAETGRVLRDELMARCYEVYLNVKELAPGLSIQEFKALIERADTHRVWQLRGMTMRFVPYVLVLCAAEFEVTRFRPEAYYFVFAKRHPHVADLWNDAGAAPAVGIWRIYPGDGTYEFETLRPEGLWTPAWVDAYQRELDGAPRG